MSPEQAAHESASYFKALVAEGVPILAATQMAQSYVYATCGKEHRVDVVHHEPDEREPWQEGYDDEG